MSDYDRNVAAFPGARAGQSVAVDAGLRAHMIRVYNYMATAVGLTGVVAWFTFNAAWEDFGLGRSTTPVQQTFSLAYALEGIFARRNRMIAARGDLYLGEALVLAEWQKLATDVHRAYDTLVATRAATSGQPTPSHVDADY